MAEPLVVTGVADGVATLRLNRPEKRNAISALMASAILEAMAAFDASPEVAVVVVTGCDGAFSAGADMNEALAAYEAGDSRFNPSADAAARVASSPRPTIAAVDGPAYGNGALLACACDLRVISERARFRFPGAEYGVVVGASALPRLVGNAMAKELLFTSRVVEADEALRIGLANRVVPPEALEAEVAELAAVIAAASPQALEWTKRVIDAASGGGDAPRLEEQSDLLLRGGEDHMRRFGGATQRVTGRGG